MNTDEITREPLDRWARSPKRLNDSKACIWACAMRLMEAGDPDAPAHISMVGNRMDLPEREISDAIKNAARRTRWSPDAAPEPEPEPESDVSEIFIVPTLPKRLRMIRLATFGRLAARRFP